MKKNRRLRSTRRQKQTAYFVLACIVTGIAISLVCSIRGGADQETQPPIARVPLGERAHLHIIFNQIFEGKHLNTNVWDPNWLGSTMTAVTPDVSGSYEKSCYDPKQLHVSGGLLYFVAVKRSCVAENGQHYAYASGLINTQKSFRFTYGYIESKIWTQTGTCGAGDSVPSDSTCISNLPAFWLVGTNKQGTQGELDILEGLQGRPWFHLHINAPKTLDPNVMESSTVHPLGGWHIYGVLWEPGKADIFYDGRKVGSIRNDLIPSWPMYIVLNLAIPAEWAPNLPGTMKVQYVRVWKFAA